MTTEKALPDLSTVRLITPPGRLSFPALTEPVENRFKHELEFSTSLRCPKGSVENNPLFRQLWNTVLRYAVNEIGARAVSKDADGRLQPEFKLHGLVDGDLSGNDHNALTWIIRARAPVTMPPVLLDADGEVLPEGRKDEVYAGANASLMVGLYYYSSEQFGTGCNFNLLGCQLLGGGDRISGAAAASPDEVKSSFGSARANLLPNKPAATGDDPLGLDFDDDIPI